MSPPRFWDWFNTWSLNFHYMWNNHIAGWSLLSSPYPVFLLRETVFLTITSFCWQAATRALRWATWHSTDTLRFSSPTPPWPDSTCENRYDRRTRGPMALDVLGNECLQAFQINIATNAQTVQFLTVHTISMYRIIFLHGKNFCLRSIQKFVYCWNRHPSLYNYVLKLLVKVLPNILSSWQI